MESKTLSAANVPSGPSAIGVPLHASLHLEKSGGGGSVVTNELDFAGNGVTYEGHVVNWRGTFGFVKVNSPHFKSNIFVHFTDISHNDRSQCNSGSNLKFQVERSLRKPGTVQAKNASIIR